MCPIYLQQKCTRFKSLWIVRCTDVHMSVKQMFLCKCVWFVLLELNNREIKTFLQILVHFLLVAFGSDSILIIRFARGCVIFLVIVSVFSLKDFRVNWQFQESETKLRRCLQKTQIFVGEYIAFYISIFSIYKRMHAI